MGGAAATVSEAGIGANCKGGPATFCMGTLLTVAVPCMPLAMTWPPAAGETEGNRVEDLTASARYACRRASMLSSSLGVALHQHCTICQNNMALMHAWHDAHERTGHIASLNAYE